MTRKNKVLLLLFLSVSLGGIAYAYHRSQAYQSALVRRIRALERRVATNNQLVANQSKQTVRGIERNVCLNLNQARDQAVLRESQLVLSRSQGLVDTLDRIRRQLCGHDPATRLASQLPAHLIRHAALLRRFVPGMPALTEGVAQAETAAWWQQLGSGGWPVAATSASLTQLMAQVRRYEALAVNQQAQKLGTRYIVFIRIGALGVNAATVVAPGAVVSAELFLAGGISRPDAPIILNGKPLRLLPTGAGVMEFRVPAARPGQPDTVRARWHGTITARACPADTVLQLDVPYLIVKRRTP